MPSPAPHQRARRCLGGSRLTADLPPWLLALLVAPFIGSFLGVLIRRLPAGEPVALDRSRCESCRRPLSLCDLVPLGSYLASRGRCRLCGARISPFHWAVELAACAIPLLAAPVSADAPTLWCGSVLGWALLALAWIDWTAMLLPDALTLPLVLLGLGATAWRAPAALTDHAAAAALGYVLFRLAAWGYRRLRDRDGLGEGDAKLMAAAGAWVGVASLSSVLLLGAGLTLGAAVIDALRHRRGLSSATRVPFGPGLCAALWLVWLSANS